jgi:hypothetical protein
MSNEEELDTSQSIPSGEDTVQEVCGTCGKPGEDMFYEANRLLLRYIKYVSNSSVLGGFSHLGKS